MNKADLAALIAPTREVEVEGHSITLRAPSLATADNLLSAVSGMEAEDGFTKYRHGLATALAETVQTDPELTQEEAHNLLLSTGGHADSPLAKELLKLCGLGPRAGEANAEEDEAPEDLPS